MITLIRSIAFLGTLLFGGLLLLLVASPDAFQRSALGFAKAEVTREIKHRLPGDTIETGLGKLSSRLGLDQQGLREVIDSDLPDIVGTAIANYCSCTPATEADAAAAAQTVRDQLDARIDKLGLARGRLTTMIEGQYDTVVAGLWRDLAIFLSSNATAFLLIGLTSLAPVARRNLIIYPTVLLSIAVVVCTGFYLYNTDWFYRLLFQDFIGFGYTVWLVLLFALLVDIVMNEARVILKIVANLPNALVPPC